jgi:hypothetical protein
LFLKSTVTLSHFSTVTGTATVASLGDEGAEQEEELFCLKLQKVEVAAVEAATMAQAEDFDRRKFIHATAHTLSTVGRDGQGRQESGGSSN